MTHLFDRLGSILAKHFWVSVSAAILVKVLMAWIFPITGDEALFWQWGLNLYPSYYDHSSATGVWVYLGQLLGDHIFFPRLVGIASQFFLFLLVYVLVHRHSGDIAKARLSSLAFVVSPLYVLFFLIITDTPLFFFSTLGVVCFAYGFRKEKAWPFVVAGLFLGLSLMSKYLIFFIAMAMGLSLLWAKPRKKIPVYALAIFIGLLPLLILHFYWAQQNCWWPLQFNVFNRVSKEKTDGLRIFSYLLQHLFLLTPWIAWSLWKYRKPFVRQLAEQRHSYLLIYLIAFVLLGATSYLATGLHWGLSFYPLIYLSIWILPTSSLQRIVAYSATLSAALVVLLLVLLPLVPRLYGGERDYVYYVMGVHGELVHEVIEELAAEMNDPLLTTTGYTPSGLMTYHSDQMYMVFNDYSAHGRNSDQWVDFRKLDGRDIIVISIYPFRKAEMNDYDMYFEEVEFRQIEISGSIFHVAMGRGFRYAAYREKYLTVINERYYQFRPGLPVGKCFFHERYFE